MFRLNLFWQISSDSCRQLAVEGDTANYPGNISRLPRTVRHSGDIQCLHDSDAELSSSHITIL